MKKEKRKKNESFFLDEIVYKIPSLSFTLFEKELLKKNKQEIKKFKSSIGIFE